MDFRRLGGSGLFVPVLTFGTGTFGGGNEFFKHQRGYAERNPFPTTQSRGWGSPRDRG